MKINSLNFYSLLLNFNSLLVNFNSFLLTFDSLLLYLNFPQMNIISFLLSLNPSWSISTPCYSI